MPRFFVNPEQISGNHINITGDDAHHISRSLRMAVGEHITLCDTDGYEYEAILEQFLPECVVASICTKKHGYTEPPARITLYQALSKGDKLDMIIQKAVECGVSRIVPFESEYCIAKKRDDSEQRKTERRCRIAAEAAKQCGRGILPTVTDTVSFNTMLESAALAELPLFMYEGTGTRSLKQIINDLNGWIPSDISVVIGSEGGFSTTENDKAISAGLTPAGLGKRILRTETASVVVLGMLIFSFEL